MAKKLTDKELKKLAQELAGSDFNVDLDILLGPSKEQIKSLKTPLEKVTNYQIMVGSSVFWSSRQAYLELLKSFLSKKIDGETFTSKFSQLRGKDLRSSNELYFIIEDQISPIPDLYYTFKAGDFTSTINELFLEIDRYVPDIEDCNMYDQNIVYSEGQLRRLIQETFVPELQESCDLNPSFFRSQVDVDQLIGRSYLIFLITILGLVTSFIAPI